MGRFSGKGGPGAARWQDYQAGGAGGGGRQAGGFRGGSQAAPVRTGKSGQQASRVILWGGLAGALVAVLIVIVSNLPHPTPVILLAVTDYAGEFAPPNAYALEDGERLEGLLTPRGWTYRDYRVHRIARDRNRTESVRSSLLGALEETPDSEAVVLYLSAHGAVDHEGRAVLLAENFNPDDLADKDDAGKRDYANWTAVEQLLADIREKLPAETRKVVFLDANRAPLYWQLAIGGNRFENAFAAALEEAVSNAKVPNLYVVNSTSPGQIGWAGPELGGSVFGYYVARGLAGRGDLDRSGEIMLDELLHYVRENVSRWVEKNRLAAQVPPIYGLPEDDDGKSRRIPAIKVADASAPDLLEVVSDGEDTRPLGEYVTAQSTAGLDHIEKARAELEELWSRHADLAPFPSDTSDSNAGNVLPAYSRHPAKWARLEILLVRAEQYLFAGRAYREKHLPGAIAESKRILAELESLPDAPPAVSLPLAQQSGNTAYRDVAGRLEAAASGPLSRDDLSRVVDDLSSAASQSPEPVESLFVRMLNAHLPRNVDLAGILPSAVGVRLLAERTAACADIRAIPWARDELEDANEDRRRQLEDRLFLGTEDGHQLAELSRSYERLHGEYENAAERVNRVALAYRVRDESLACLPHLALWHLTGLGIDAQESQSAAKGDADRRNAQHLQQLQLVNEWRDQAEALGRELIGGGEEVGTSVPDLAAMHQAIKAIPSQFRGQAGDEEQPRQMWLALQTPLLTGGDRTGVRERFVTMLKAQSKSAPSDAELPPISSLSTDDERPGGRQPAGTRASLLAAFFPSGGEGATAVSSNPRDILERQDHEARAAATWTAFRRRHQEWTPTLLKLNRYRQYVWLARRTVDDFWGPPPGADADGQRYFEQVAAECQKHIERARTVAKELGGRLPDQDAEKELARVLAARRDASRAGIHFSQVSSLRAERLNPLAVRCPEAGLPGGQAVAWASAEFGLKVGDQSGARMALATANPPADCQLLYSGNLGSQEQKVARLAVLFRGHVWPSEDLPLPTGHFRTVVWEKPPPAPPRVTVEGDEKQVPYVLFILDCSYSMEADFGGINRMVAAKNGLLKVVKSLLENEGKFEVGLILYGSRYSDTGGKPMGPQGPATWAEVLSDVEPVFLHRVLNRELIADFERELEGVTFTGITPLYHAIRQGLSGARLAPDQLMQVVVITDGADTQQAYKEVKVRAGQLDPRFATTNEHDVRAELRKLGKQVRLDFLGMGFDRNDAAIKALHTLASETGGRFHNLANTLDLESSIEELLRPAQFSVRHATRTEPREAPIDLEETWVVREENLGGGEEFVVAMHRVEKPPLARVLLEGGEHLLLQYRRDSSVSSSLVHLRYFGTPAVGRVPVVENVANPLARRAVFSPAACYVAAHKPERDRNGAAVFRVSVQNDEERDFSLRPRHVWAEIRPCLNGRPREEWPVFPFFDLRFEEGTPVPVLLFTIPEWTWDETDAEIRVWCSYERDVEVRELPIRIGADAPDSQTLGGVDTLPGVTFDADLIKQNDARQFQVIISEYHNEEPMDLYSARVQMSPQPDAARHMYYTESNLVRHEFTFDNATVLGVEEAKILITPREAIQSPQRAVAVDGGSVNGREVGPLRIRVPRQ